MKVGITGHQKLGSQETVEWISNALVDIINKYKVDKGFTSLAIGTDQLYAELLRENNLPYIAIIPCEKYEKTFQTNRHLNKYRELLQYASDAMILTYNEPSETAFYEAGKLVVNLSDMVIAVWDGKEAKGLGGTGDIVKYAISRGKIIIHINPTTRKSSELIY